VAPQACTRGGESQLGLIEGLCVGIRAIAHRTWAATKPWALVRKQRAASSEAAWSVSGAHALGMKLADGAGCFLTLARHTVQMGQPNFHGLNIVFKYSIYSKFEKYKSCTSSPPKFSKLYQIVYKFKMNNFPFGKEFKFPTQFELKI
jgi:hypothetical protein